MGSANGATTKKNKYVGCLPIDRSKTSKKKLKGEHKRDRKFIAAISFSEFPDTEHTIIKDKTQGKDEDNEMTKKRPTQRPENRIHNPGYDEMTNVIQFQRCGERNCESERLYSDCDEMTKKKLTLKPEKIDFVNQSSYSGPDSKEQSFIDKLSSNRMESDYNEVLEEYTKVSHDKDSKDLSFDGNTYISVLNQSGLSKVIGNQVIDKDSFREFIAKREVFDHKRYEILPDPLGQGSFCKVEKAWDTQRAKFVAIKTYFEEGGWEEVLWNEINVYNKMKKPKYSARLLKITKLDSENPPKIRFILEAGVCNLSQIRQQRRDEKALYTEKELLQIIYDISKGLQELKEAGIKHKDIKDANIIYCKNPSRYLLIDFNVSRVGTSELKGSDGGGTEFYENNEVKEKDFDVWCLGVTILKLLNLEKILPSTMKECKHKKNRFKVFLKKLLEENSSTLLKENKIKEKISDDFYNLLSRMLNLNEKEKIPSVEELINICSKILSKLSSKKLIKTSIFANKLTYNDDIYARKVEINKIESYLERHPVMFNQLLTGYKKIFDYDICFLLKKYELKRFEENNPIKKGDEKNIKRLKIVHDCMKYASISGTRVEEALKLGKDHKKSFQALDSQTVEKINLKANFYKISGRLYKHQFKLNEAFENTMNALIERAEVKLEFKPNLLDITLDQNKLDLIKVKIKENLQKSEMISKKILRKLIKDIRELGELYFELCRYDFAESMYTFNQELFEWVKIEEDKKNLEYKIEMDLLSVNLKRKSLHDLKENFEKIKRIYETYKLNIEEITSMRAFSLVNIGQFFEKYEYFKPALIIYRTYKKFLEVAHFTKYSRFYIRACLLKANLFLNLSIFENALPEIKEAMKLSKGLEADNPLKAECYQVKGFAYYKLGAQKKAESAYTKAEQILKGTANKLKQGNQPDLEFLEEKIGTLTLSQTELALESDDNAKFNQYSSQTLTIFNLIGKKKISFSLPKLSKLKLLMGQYYLKSNDITKASKEFEAGLKTLANKDGSIKANLDSARLYLNLAVCKYLDSEVEPIEFLRSENKKIEKKYLLTAINIFKNILQETHPELLSSNSINTILNREDFDISNQGLESFSLTVSRKYASAVLNDDKTYTVEVNKILKIISSFLEKTSNESAAMISEQNDYLKIRLEFFKSMKNMTD